MKMKLKSLISFLALTFCFCLVIVVGYTVARYAGVYDVGSFFLSVEEGEIDPGKAYTLYYHTFDENNNDVIYKEEVVYQNIPFELEAAPPQHSGYSFLGWSPQGAWMVDDESLYEGSLDYENNAELERVYIRNMKGAGETTNVASLLQDVDNGEIHLYDLYWDFYIRVSCQGEDACPRYRYTFRTYDPGITATTSSSPLFYREYYNYGINSYIIRFDCLGETHTFYVHPGMQCRLGTEFYVDQEYPLKDYYFDFYLNGELFGEENSNNVFFWFYDSVEYVVVAEARNNTNPDNCFAAGTLITMADGTKLPVEQVHTGDMVRVFDHENGCYTSSPILFIEDDGVMKWPVINLEFSDGTTQKFIYEHGLFDLDLNKYIYITEENFQDFIGHRFAKEEASGYSVITLERAWVQSEYTGCYSLTTEYHMNVFANGMFSMPGGITGLFNFFEYDENLAYDKELMAQDIATYGLFAYEDFAPYMSEETFNTIFPIKYLKVSIGKGLVTFEDLEYIIERYIYGHDLDS